MNGRTLLTIALSVLVVAVLAGIGIGIYNAGVSQGIAQAATLPEGTTIVAPVGYGYGYGYGHPGFFGFGFLWILFPIFFILLLVGIARAAFGRGRGWGPGGWGPGGHGPGGRGPNGWHEERERWIADYHQRLHDDAPGRTPPAGQS